MLITEYKETKRKLLSLLEGEINFSKYSVDEYIIELDSYPRIARWDYMSGKTKNFTQDFLSDHNEEVLGVFHKLILSMLVLRTYDKKEVNAYIKNVDKYYKRYFTQLLPRLSSQSNNKSFNYSNKRFNFELNICRGFIIPMAPQYLNPDIISRGVLFRNGPKQFFRGLIYMVFKLKGTKPVFKLHLNSNDSFAMSKFNEEGWREEFMEIAEIFIANRKIKGLSGTTWFFDPQLLTISPEIAYILKLFLECNAIVMHNGLDDDTLKEALFMNNNRRELYKIGQYKPGRFTTFISRKDLINWYYQNNISK